MGPGLGSAGLLHGVVFLVGPEEMPQDPVFRGAAVRPFLCKHLGTVLRVFLCSGEQLDELWNENGPLWVTPSFLVF